jgi:hypothetical protein
MTATAPATVIRTLRYGKGYAGKLGSKPDIARITGSDTRYGFRREFLKPISLTREPFNRSRTLIHMTYALTEGLYELSAEGERWFEMAYTTHDGVDATASVSDARVTAWVAALDAGQTDRGARLVSRPADPQETE